MRLINERGRFVQSIMDAANGQLRRRLSAQKTALGTDLVRPNALCRRRLFINVGTI